MRHTQHSHAQHVISVVLHYAMVDVFCIKSGTFLDFVRSFSGSHTDTHIPFSCKQEEEIERKRISTLTHIFLFDMHSISFSYLARTCTQTQLCDAQVFCPCPFCLVLFFRLRCSPSLFQRAYGNVCIDTLFFDDFGALLLLSSINFPKHYPDFSVIK